MKAKKIISLLCTVAISLSLFIGCNPASKTETNEDGKNVRVLTSLMEMNDGWIRNFTPFGSSVYQFVSGFMFEPLVIFDNMNNNRETMWLAEDIISEPDYKTLTVKVRKGVKWSDGEDFNAEDVAFTFTYSKDHPELDTGGDWGENGKIEKVEIIDDYTVQIVMKEANRFHRNDIFLQRWMVPEHIWSKIDNPSTYVYEDPVVTGAFSVVKSVTPEMVVLGRNETYWKGDELEVDELRVPQYNGNDAGLALLESGTIDWAHLFIPNIEDTYVKGDEHKKYWYGTNDSVRLSFNYMTKNEGNNKAFHSEDFRKAVSLAVDRKGIIDSAVFGYLDDLVPTVTGLPPALFAYKDEEAEKVADQYTIYDLDKATKILDEAGFVDKDGDGYRDNPDGSSIKFDIVSPAGWSDWNDGAVIAAEGLRKIGINASANAKDLGVVIDSWATGDFDMAYTAYGSSPNIWKYYFDTIGDQERFLTSTWWSTCQNNYKNDELTALIAEMPQASDERLEEITKYIEEFFANNMINVPILHNGNWFIYNDSRFTGWATAENSFVNPANCIHDSKILQLMSLKAVE